MNIDVENVIEIMHKSNYFDAWKNVLLGPNTVDEWEHILKNSDNANLYEMLSVQLHNNNVPYVIVSEYIDEFFRYCKKNKHRHKIKNNIAQAYLAKKLLDDKSFINIELKKKFSVSLESKKDLINAHMNWMKNFINTVLGRPQYFELDPTKCFVGKWLIEEKENVPFTLVELHRNLHSMAQSALRMYQKEDYAYFLLLYTDMLSASYQIRDTIMNIYFNRRISSIYQDPITNKANNFQLLYDIKHNSVGYSIFMFNIKEFRKMNLLYGHNLGDKILNTVVNLAGSIKNIFNIYRIYGDEFAIVFESVYQEQVLVEFKKLFLNNEFTFDKEKMSFSFYGSVAKVSEHVLEHCEYGLMISKQHYGEIVDVNSIDESIFLNYANEISFSQQLKLAFLDNRILAHYQPIMDLKTKSIVKYEVLMRIKNINGEIMYPIEFLDVLKDMYLYPEVTKMIVERSFDFFEDQVYDFSINLSYADVINEDTKAFILELLKANKETAKRCVFELLEYDAILDFKEVGEFFAELRSYGVKIALDDFGVGYSNYDMVSKLDIDVIKIDGSLVETLLTSEKSRAIVESIVSVSKKMKAQVVVEFVSSQEIYDEVSKLDIEFAQGYFIGKPNESLEILY